MSLSNNSAACSVCFGSGFDTAGKPCPFAPHRDAATLRQAPAQGGVTEADEPIGHPRSETDTRDEIELFLRDAYAAGCHAARATSPMLAITYAHREAPKLRAALSAQQQETPCSLDEALAVIEAWASHGGQVHGNAAAHFRELVDRVAPQQQGQGEAVAWRVPIASWFEYFSNEDLARAARAEYEGDHEIDIESEDHAEPEPLYTAPPAQPAERVPEAVLGYCSRDDAERLLKRKGEERINFSHIEVWNRQSEFYPVALAATPAPAEEGDGKDDASRYAFVREAFDGMTTSQSERFLELLGIEGDVFKPLDDAIDTTTGAAR